MNAPRRLAPWRRTFQWATSLALLLIPFLRTGGASLLRIDLPSRTLLAFGRAFRLDELYLFLLVVVGAVLAILLLTLVLGRVWCGWACPQTTLSDAVEGFAARIGGRSCRGVLELGSWQRVLVHLLSALLGGLVAANLIWYFVSPYEFFPRLLAGELPVPALWTLGVIGGGVYLDLVFVRRSFCRTVCPYGRIQTAVVDAATLTLRVSPSEAGRCIDCGACVRACPTGIDIRKGYQVECINCGRCLDACRGVMAKRGEPGIIGYAFGTEGRGPRALLNPRVGLVALASVAVAVVLVSVTSGQSEVTLAVRRSAAPPRVLPNGETAVFFTGYVGNRGAKEVLLSLTADGPGGPLGLRGPVGSFPVTAGGRRQVDFALLLPPVVTGNPLPVTLRVSAGPSGPEARATVTVSPEGKRGADG